MDRAALRIIRNLSILLAIPFTLWMGWLFLWFASDYATFDDALRRILPILGMMGVSAPLGALGFLLSWGAFWFSQGALWRSEWVQYDTDSSEE